MHSGTGFESTKRETIRIKPLPSTDLILGDWRYLDGRTKHGMKLYCVHRRKQRRCVPATLVNFSVGGPWSEARGRSFTRRGRLGHEAGEGSNRGTRPKGARFLRSRQGNALLRGRGRLHCGPSRRGRRVVRDSDDVVALGLLAAFRGGGDLVHLPLTGGILLASGGGNLCHRRVAHLFHSGPACQDKSIKNN